MFDCPKSQKQMNSGLLFLVLVGVLITRNPYFANYEPGTTSFNFSGGLWSWIFLAIGQFISYPSVILPVSLPGRGCSSIDIKIKPKKAGGRADV